MISDCPTQGVSGGEVSDARDTRVLLKPYVMFQLLQVQSNVSSRCKSICGPNSYDRPSKILRTASTLRITTYDTKELMAVLSSERCC